MERPGFTRKKRGSSWGPRGAHGAVPQSSGHAGAERLPGLGGTRRRAKEAAKLALSPSEASPASAGRRVGAQSTRPASEPRSCSVGAPRDGLRFASSRPSGPTRPQRWPLPL